MRKEGDFETNSDVIDVIYLSEDSKTKNEEEKVKKDTEEFGDEVKACVDSRIYERPYFFLGVPFIIVFGGIGSKYESIFSIEYEGKIIVVLYHGFCLVSAEIGTGGKSWEYREMSLLRTGLKT